MKNLLRILLKTVLPIGLGLYLFYFFFHSMSDEMLHVFYQSLKKANYFWISLAILLGIIAYFLRAIRWRLVLEPMGYSTPLAHRYHAVMIGYLVNLTIPRAGEASRSAMLFRSDAVPFSKSFGTIIAERAIDLIILAFIGFLTALFVYDDFWFIQHQIETTFQSKEVPSSTGTYFLLGFLGLILLLTLLLIWKKDLRLKLLSLISEVWQGVMSIFKAKQPFLYVVYTLLIWLCYLIMFYLPFLAFEETASIPMTGVLLAFCAGAIGITFTNGGIGTYPLLVGMVVALYIQQDYPLDAKPIGNALGLLIWSSQTMIMIVLGLISLYLLPKNHKKTS